MKKKMFFALAALLVFVISDSCLVYGGYLPPVFEYNPVGITVLLEDIYQLNQKYQEDQDINRGEAAEFLINRYKKYADADIDGNYRSGYSCCGVAGADGYIDYEVCYYYPGSSYVSGDILLLMSMLTGESICLNEPPEELEKFIERNSKTAKQAREQYFYVRNHLSEDEYGGIYYNYDYESGCGKLCIMLTDESKASLLEKEGISWEKTEVSRTQIYAKLQYLWKEREKLNIADVRSYVYDDTLVICGYDTEQKFRKNLEMEELERDYYVLAEEADITDQDTISEYLENKKQIYYGRSESFWSKMQECLEQLKQIYAEYTYENLFTLVYMDCNYHIYTNFSDELEEYISGVPYYKNEKNPFDEDHYGDPEQVALKIILEKYKVLYPEKDYQELYEQYGKEINESKILSQEEKRSRYLWEIFQGEQLIEENVQKQKEEAEEKSSALAAAGIVMLITGIGIMAVIKRRV